MYDMIPPYGTLNDVIPGSPWRPEPAERYNAVNELLKQEPSPPPAYQPAVFHESCLKICNSSDRQLPIGSAVQIDTEFINDENYKINSRNFYAFGKAVEKIDCFWGIALDNIPPGAWGMVQISGIAVVSPVRGEYGFIDPQLPQYDPKARHDYVFPGLDGSWYYGTRGGARVISAVSSPSAALVRLGTASNHYTGAFAVLDNGDGTLTVKGGETDLKGSSSATGITAGRGGLSIGDTLIQAAKSPRVISLTADLTENEHGYWKLEFVQSESTGNPEEKELFIPGKRLFWPIARYRMSSAGVPVIIQLWTGGIINFKDRYYVE